MIAIKTTRPYKITSSTIYHLVLWLFSIITWWVRCYFLIISLYIGWLVLALKYKSKVNLPSAAKSSLASENSPSSIPSPTYQCTNARLEYMRSNLWLRAFQASAIAVVLESMQLNGQVSYKRCNKFGWGNAYTALLTFAKSPLGTNWGGWKQIPILKPVGHQSTNWMVFLVLSEATAAWTSLVLTIPLYNRQVAIYFPFRGSHLTIWLWGSKQELEISWTELASWEARAADMTGAYDTNGKWILGYGTRLVWNSLRSTFKEPSKRREAVIEETTTRS